MEAIRTSPGSFVLCGFPRSVRISSLAYTGMRLSVQWSLYNPALSQSGPFSSPALPEGQWRLAHSNVLSLVWCGSLERRCQFMCRSRHLPAVQNYEIHPKRKICH
ncbi:hypothetical protein AVEN_189256-1 [Araneus ventricosus]|uniref:Uncharacterized protein n=1 Tax=Araneus ventricosus TaxID=182803 RepID=A0A4Y2N2R7_ARAVE|nr:hypothetical protein AVEN_9522-1 [Araneus ventricosus]GBN31885.1 hypothetical protein AVEN_78436-1 [Araneus ventricosus]GBN32146.1 hypothetical protein AVEN_189906-1 [Araneus ventricosus]GBN32244.1 hypothetical protein AVEN_189256-1 [Araneus ventricosus]